MMFGKSKEDQDMNEQGMKIKTHVIHERSDKSKFEKEVQKVYTQALAETVGDKLPEIQYSAFSLGSQSVYTALVIWYVG